MNLGLEMVETNLAINFEYIIFIVLIVGSIIFMAKSFQLGIILLLAESAGVFIWFYEQDLEYTYPLITILLCIVILSLTLLPVSKTSKTGGLT